jgi:hypothetical protein
LETLGTALCRQVLSAHLSRKPDTGEIRMTIGRARSRSSRWQRFGVGFSEAGYRDLASSGFRRPILGVNRHSKSTECDKKTDHHESVYGHPASHTHLPFGLTRWFEMKTAN